MSGEPTRAVSRAAIAACGRLVSSRLTYVEVHAALAAARRDRRISVRELKSAAEAFDIIWEDVEVLDLTEAVGVSAARISERFALRSGDSIQLASALALEDDRLVLIALDGRLRRAAADAGLAVAP